jgi:serine/threonine-protein kinase RsbW/stage II sporulation protein AB (anti-sigma F factor)
MSAEDTADAGDTAQRRLSREWAALPTTVAAARAAAVEFATAVGAGPAALAAIKLAVSEAVTNTVLHAYRGREAPGPVALVADCDSEIIEIAVSDQGIGMVPRADSPGSGLGLPLIAQMTDTFEIEHGELGGTRLRMRFSL